MGVTGTDFEREGQVERKRAKGGTRESRARGREWACDTLRKGERVGDWEVVSFLGAGGGGVVYGVQEVVEGRKSGRRGALKIFPHGVVDDFHGRDKLQQEARVLRKFKDNPSMPAFYAEGTHRGLFYFIIEELRPVAPKLLPKTISDVKSFMLSVLESVRALHDAGLVHCDIKPPNIARRPSDGRYVLIDFGSVHRKERGRHLWWEEGKTLNTQNGVYQREGTRGYDPPEYSFAPARDIYALGHLIRDCFEEKVPPEWSQIINRCISNRPSLRYRTVKALQEDVGNIERIRSALYWELRKERISEQRRTEQSLLLAERREVAWSDILEPMKTRSRKGMKVLRVRFPKDTVPRLHYIVKEPCVLPPNTLLLISGRGVLEADISGPESAVVALRVYAVLHNTSAALPPENNLTYVLVGPGSYLNFPNLEQKDYKRFFPDPDPAKRRILQDIDAATSFRFHGPETFSGIEEQTIKAIEHSELPASYKKRLQSYFRGEIFDILPPDVVEERKSRKSKRGKA